MKDKLLRFFVVNTIKQRDHFELNFAVTEELW